MTGLPIALVLLYFAIGQVLSALIVQSVANMNRRYHFTRDDFDFRDIYWVVASGLFWPIIGLYVIYHVNRYARLFRYREPCLCVHNRGRHAHSPSGKYTGHCTARRPIPTAVLFDPEKDIPFERCECTDFRPAPLEESR